MKIEIKNRWNGAVIFETDAETIGGAVAEAIAAKSNLRDANLRGANLRDANLRGANLRDAKEWENILPQRTIVAEGEIVGYKKLLGGTICKLKIPADAKRVGGLIGRKCRAEYAVVLEGEGRSMHHQSFSYSVGQTVRPDSFDPDPRNECAPGIHFFLTREEAEAY